MKKKEDRTPKLKLSQYLIQVHKIADIPIEKANEMKKLAFKNPDHGQRSKDKINTPTLRRDAWDEIYQQVMEKDLVKSNE